MREMRQFQSRRALDAGCVNPGEGYIASFRRFRNKNQFIGRLVANPAIPICIMSE